MSNKAYGGRFGAFADGAVITSGTFVLATGIVLGLAQLFGGIDTLPQVVQNVIGPLSSFVPMLLAPALVWRLRGRRFAGRVVAGFAAGIGAALATSAALVTLLSTIDRAAAGGAPVDAPSIVTIIVAGLLALGFLAIVAWIGVLAVRDLRAPRPDSRALDLVRIGGVVAIALLIIAMGVVAVVAPGSEALEMPVFAIITGIIGGFMLLGAEIACRYLSRGADDPTFVPGSEA